MQIIGSILVHVDDFVFAGDETNSKCTAAIQAIRGLYDWGEGQTGNITQCGVNIIKDEQGILLMNEEYGKDLKPIQINKYRKRKMTGMATESEQKQMQEIAGSGQGCGTQWMPQVLS